LLVWSVWAWALTWLPIPFAPNAPAMALIIGGSFLCVPVFMATQFSYRLATIPDALQGRVSSVFRLVAFGSMPLGLALTGLLLQRFGPVVMGAGDLRAAARTGRGHDVLPPPLGDNLTRHFNTLPAKAQQAR
jgi:hypothetical protein